MESKGRSGIIDTVDLYNCTIPLVPRGSMGKGDKRSKGDFHLDVVVFLYYRRIISN